MDFLRVLWGDIKNISCKKLLILAVTVVVMIPIIYGGLYLAAFWDPYGKTEKLPVAVVNMDTGSKMNGKKVNYGNDIVDNLKDNKDLDWQFMNSRSEAGNSLEKGDSYAMVIIPQDFSQRLSQVENGVLKKPELTFVTNKKKNYIVGLIMDKAGGALKDDVNKNIIDNIGVEVYDNLYDLKDGMEEASDGSGKIKDGVSQMKNKMPELEDGVNKLYDGSSSLADNMDTAVDGSNDLKDGLGTLNEKMPDLVDGVGKLLKGSSKLTGKLGDAWDGSKTLRNGIDSLNDKMPDMEDGVNSLYDGSVSLMEGLQEMDDNMPKLIDGVSDLRDGSEKLRDGLSSAKNGSQNLVDGLGQMKDGVMSNLSSQLSSNLPSMVAGLNQMKGGLSGIPGMEPIAALIGDASSKLSDITPGVSDLNSISSNLADAKSDLDQVKSILSQISNPQLDDVKSGIDTINSGISQFQSGIQSAAQLDSGFGQLVNGASSLNSGLDQLYDGSSDLYDGLDELYGKTQDLKDGTDSLYEGSENLTDGIGQFKSTVPDLENGVDSLLDGSMDLSDGLMKIHDGSQTLTDNLGTLNSKMPDIQSGVQKLYDGSTDLSDGLLKLSDGSKALRDGIKKIRDNIPQLKDGVNKIYDGIATLHGKLADGAEQLCEKLGPTSGAMGNFLSEPLNMEDDPLYKVNGYGEGLAPYFISLGLWVGALLMFFIITEKPNVNKEVGPISNVLGKYMTYGILGVFQAVALSFVVVKLGLNPSNMTAYYGFNIFLSLTFIAIMQNLVFIFGDVGRFISIVALILQLTSSGGTFPSELLPKFFKFVGTFLPFTYSVSAIREISWGIDYNVLNRDIRVLASYLVVFLILTLVVEKFFGKYTINISMRDLSDEKSGNAQ